jgi:hypothetical protein
VRQLVGAFDKQESSIMPPTLQSSNKSSHSTMVSTSLRDSEYKGKATFDLVLELANGGQDGSENRKEFVGLVRAARSVLSLGEQAGPKDVVAR